LILHNPYLVCILFAYTTTMSGDRAWPSVQRKSEWICSMP